MVEVKKLFGTGSRVGDPLIIDFPESSMIAYCRDNYLVFQDYKGGASKTPNVKFSESPIEIGNFFLALSYLRHLF